MKAEIRFSGLITDLKAENVCLFIDQLVAQGESEFTLFISASRGGDLAPTYKIIEKIKRSKLLCRTIAEGSIASCAVILFSAGDERLAKPLAKFIFHEPGLDVRITASMQDAEILDLLKVKNSLNMSADQTYEFVSKQIKCSATDVKEMFKKGITFNSAEAKRIGLIHGILHPVTA